MIHNTEEFVKLLKKENELLVIEDEVDPYLELAEIQRRVSAKKGPALLFTNVKGSRFSVATNLYGSEKRIRLAFGKKPEEFIRRAADIAMHLSPSMATAKKAFPLIFDGLKVGMKKIRNAPVLQGQIADATELPALHCWPEDGGRFITLPLVYTEHPDGGANLGMYRIQILDKKTTGMHIQIHRGGGFHHHEAEKRNMALPAHIYVGGPPALTLAAIAPLPEGINELLLASLLMGERLKITRNSSISPLPVVADADFVIVGEIPPHKRKPEGPFGDHYGYYSLKHDYPFLNIKGIYHRKNAIWPATVVGRPPQEDHYIAEYLQELLSPMFPLVMPQVKSVWAYEESGVHSLAGAVVKERYYRESFMAALRVLSEGQLSLSKVLLVTDVDVELRNFRETFIAFLERFVPERDLYILSNISHDTLDYTSPEVNKGSKSVWMGVGKPVNKLKKGYTGSFSLRAFDMPKVFYPGVLIVRAPGWKKNDRMPERLLKEESIQGYQFVFIVDNPDEIKNDHDFIWVVFTRFEPAADIYGEKKVIRNHIAFSGPVVVDCRMKPWYPGVLVPDEATVRRVDERFGMMLDRL